MIYFKKYFLFVFVLLFLGCFGALSYIDFLSANIQNAKPDLKSASFFEKDRILKEKYKKFETDYSDNFSNKLGFVETYGGLQKMLGKKLIDDPVSFRRVYKGENDMLYYIIPKKDINDDAVKSITNLRDNLDVPVIFVMPPNKHSIASTNFPYGVLDYSTTNSDDLYKKLVEGGIITLNLNEDYFKDKLDDAKSFYMTDTHWKNETAFWGYQKTFEFLKSQMSHKLSNSDNSNDLSNYSIQKFDNTFIGSMGKRVGKNYIDKKDDYSLIIPAFETSYNYKKYDENYNMVSEKLGKFEEVFVDKSILEDKDEYKDKYTTMMGYGSPYEIITNQKVKDNSKIVIIKDSYAMPFSAYLSTNVNSIHMFDTRYENIRKTLLSTIKTIKPDMVMFVCSPSSVFYFEDMFKF